MSFLHPVTEDTFEWRPAITDESRRILAEIERLPAQRLGPSAFDRRGARRDGRGNRLV